MGHAVRARPTWCRSPTRTTPPAARTPTTPGRRRRYTGKALAQPFGYSSPVRSVDQTWDPASLREHTLALHTAGGQPSWTGIAAAAHLGLRSNYFRIIQVTLNANSKPVKAGGIVTVTGRVWPRPTGAVKLLRRVAGTSAWTVAYPSSRSAPGVGSRSRPPR